MTEEAKADGATSDLEQLKTVFNTALNKMKRLDTPMEEISLLCEAIKAAIQTGRMGTEPAFAEWIYKDVAIGIMQKLAKTSSFDQ
jgi:hypothetical protein